jgi:hypothetical protein
MINKKNEQIRWLKLKEHFNCCFACNEFISFCEKLLYLTLAPYLRPVGKKEMEQKWLFAIHGTGKYRSS